MTRHATVVQVFVASPSDVQEERDLLETVVTELNRTWSNTLGVIFELLRWETHVRPAFGSDPQQVVNEQIGDDYDVFIGVLWGRFGTPTPRAPSGTIEEFERAFRRLEGPRAAEVMFYFKDTPIPPSKIDPDQLKLVQEFRASLSERGGIYAAFEDTRGFESSLKAHLAALAQKFASADRAAPQEPTTALPASLVAEDELGYLDYVELYESRMQDLNAVLETIGEATTRVGEQMRQRTEEADLLNKDTPDTKAARRVVKRAADDMNAYAQILANHLPIMTSSREAALNALTQALALHRDFGGTDHSSLPSLRVSLRTLADAIHGSKESLAGYRKSVGELPRMTSELNRAKRAVVGQLDVMLIELESMSHTITNILEAVDKMLVESQVG